jgi:hypothetical protein
MDFTFGPGTAAHVAADVEEAGALDFVLGLEVDLAPRPRARRRQAARRRPREELRAGHGRGVGGERAMLSARVLSRSYMHGVMPQWALAGLKAEPKVLALVRARFLWHFLYPETRAQ